MERWRRRSRRLTWVSIVASAALIVPGLLGTGGTLPLAAVLGSFAGALWVVREQLTTLPTVVGYDLGWYASDCWLGVLLGAVVVLLTVGVSPAELKALGGVAGLVGMVNYFLRPLFLFLVIRLQGLFGTDR